MDHAEVRGLLDLAAVEPGGLDRLMAGDTPVAIAVAGHLAGCEDCTEEFGRLRRESSILRGVIATQPPPELRARTLAYVAAVGRPRGAAALAPPTAPPSIRPSTPIEALAPAPTAAIPPLRRAPRTRLAWLAAAAALVVATSAVTGAVVSSMKDSAARQASPELEGLTDVATATLRLDTQPDVHRVVLVPNARTTRLGTLVFSPGTRELVVVAEGLAAPAAGQEYRCWVEIAGTRQRLGRMYLSGDLAYWVGDAPVLAAVPPGSLFGVSLADIGSPGDAGPAILSGTLQTT